MQETQVQSLDQEDSLEKKPVTHSRILFWKIPWTKEPSRPQSMGLQSQTWLSTHVRADVGKLAPSHVLLKCTKWYVQDNMTISGFLMGSRGRKRGKKEERLWLILALSAWQITEIFSIWWWWFSHQIVSDSWNAMDCSLPDSFVHGILQARILEWVAISFSRGSSQPRDRSQVSCIAGRFFTNWATREALSQFTHLYFTMLHFYNQHEIFCEIKNFSKLTSKLTITYYTVSFYWRLKFCFILSQITTHTTTTPPHSKQYW